MSQPSTLSVERGLARAGRIRLATVLLWGQGLYYFVTGVWPLVSISTFEMITGPKTEDWLVQTVGALIVVIAITLLTSAWKRRSPPEVVLLAVGSAGALTAVDVVFVARGMIPPIYLLDAAAEVVLIAAWAWALFRGSHGGLTA